MSKPCVHMSYTGSTETTHTNCQNAEAATDWLPLSLPALTDVATHEQMVCLMANSMPADRYVMLHRRNLQHLQSTNIRGCRPSKNLITLLGARGTLTSELIRLMQAACFWR